MKSRLRYSLRTLVLSVLVIAIALTWYNQWWQRTALCNLSTRLAVAESELDFRRCVDSVIFGLQLHNDYHQRAFQIIGRARLRNNSEDSPVILEQIIPSNPRRIQLDEEGSRMIVIFCNDSHSEPGYVDTVAALLENGRLLDIEIRESNTRHEWHTTSVEDIDSNGQIDLVFNCRPGGFAMSNSDKLVSYPVGVDGFREMMETIMMPSDSN